jgi:acyl-CoA reductase-like NAD-dependent aldehyde dehydrogenase
MGKDSCRNRRGCVSRWQAKYIAEFGGMKHSGYGRESGFQAVYEYTRPKTVWINTSSEPLGSQFVAR